VPAIGAKALLEDRGKVGEEEGEVPTFHKKKRGKGGERNARI